MAIAFGSIGHCAERSDFVGSTVGMLTSQLAYAAEACSLLCSLTVVFGEYR